MTKTITNAQELEQALLEMDLTEADVLSYNDEDDNESY